MQVDGHFQLTTYRHYPIAFEVGALAGHVAFQSPLGRLQARALGAGALHSFLKEGNQRLG